MDPLQVLEATVGGLCSRGISWVEAFLGGPHIIAHVVDYYMDFSSEVDKAKVEDHPKHSSKLSMKDW